MEIEKSHHLLSASQGTPKARGMIPSEFKGPRTREANRLIPESEGPRTRSSDVQGQKMDIQFKERVNLYFLHLFVLLRP